MDLVSIGLLSISTDLVSVTVPGGWLPLHGCLRALLRAYGSRLAAHPGITAHFGRHHLQAHLLATSLMILFKMKMLHTKATKLNNNSVIVGNSGHL